MRRVLALTVLSVYCSFILSGSILADGYSVRNAIVATARAQDGKPYVYGAAGPNSFDCSGLVMYCFSQNGVSIGVHSSSAQWGMCDALGSKNDLLPGDLVFYGDLSHVGIWTGSGVFAADSPYFGIHEHNWGWDTGYTKFGRIRASYWPNGDNSYNPIVAPGDPNLGGPGNGAWYPLGTDITFYAYNNGGTSPETRIWVDGGPDWGWGNYEGQHWGAPGSGTYTWHGQKHNAAGYSNVVTWSFHINYPPNSPSLSSPADGAILASRSIPLSWNGADDPDGGPGAVRYCVNRNNWGGETGWIGTGTSTSLTAPSDGTFTWQVKAADDWNESGFSGTRSFTVDTVAPSVSTAIVPASPNGNAGWYVTKPSFSVSASDVTTHVAHTWYVLDGASPVGYSTPVLLNDGIHTYSGRADDDAANVGVSATSTAKVDTLAPVVTVVVSPSSSNGENGWYTVQPTIAVSAVDPNGSDGSGVSSRFYSIDGSEQPYTSEVTIPLGAHAVTGRAADVAGNSATVPVEIDVDTTAPVFVSVDTTETSGSLDTLTASWEFADPESDIAEYEYSIYREAGETDEFVAGPFVTDQPHAYQTNLSLTRGETYYFIVRAKNYAGTYSVYVPSDGILATEETRDVAPEMNSGGVSAEPRTSENYLVLDSFGQFVVDTSTSASFTLESGYWHSELTTTPVETIAIAKATENNKLVQLGSAAKPVVVTVAPGVFADRFYVEQPDRSSGIAVSFGAGLTSSLIPGDRVWILGTLNESGGERIIEYAAAGFVLHSDPLGALFVTNGWLGGSDLNSLTKGVEGAAGLNNIGLLVKTCGQVKQVDPSGAYFYISDGSSITDGTLTNGEANVGVRVAADGRSYTGQFVTVTGISSCFVDEGGKSQRLIRPVTITPLQ
jgi:hypothetical protein